MKTTDDARVKRELCLQLMERYRRRGELIANAAYSLPPKPLLAMLTDSVGLSETQSCIEMHLLWQDFRRAEQWNHDNGNQPPASLSSALRLVQRWLAEEMRSVQPQPI